MRYHLDTIPVWDALHKESECLLCTLRKDMEDILVDRYLGGSVMEPDTRIQVNAKGFCQTHHRQLYARQNRLGHALMIQSHMDEMRDKLNALFDEQAGMAPKSRFAFLSRKESTTPSHGGASTALVSTCILCDALDMQMKRFAFTLLHLFKTDSAFRTALSAAKGICLPDTLLLLSMARDELKADLFTQFVATLRSITMAAFERNKEDIDWFTLKFDYRNADKPWKNSRNAVERSVNFLRGQCIGNENDTACP